MRFNQNNNFGSNTNNIGLNTVTQNRISEEQNRQFGSNWYFYNNTTLIISGLILIIVPNVENSLKSGNPDLFAHEHINYFTTSTIKKHFLNFLLSPSLIISP